MQTLYTTEHVTTKIDHDLKIIRWIPLEYVPIDEWKASLTLGLQASLENKMYYWLNDMTFFQSFQADQLDFVNNNVNDFIVQNNLFVHLAFKKSKYNTGNIALDIYKDYSRTWYKKYIVTTSFDDIKDAESWLLLKQSINNVPDIKNVSSNLLAVTGFS